ncbi:MAG: hypothetical protein N2489_06680 [Clostridia bacterium]|nr:hypothetical protein [Clostridia bacterium]
MSTAKKTHENNDFETTIREYLKQAREKLDKELLGTREAIRLIAGDKTKEFIRTMDKGLDKKERDFLSALIIASMYQSFCYGYGIGKIEGTTNNKVFL